MTPPPITGPGRGAALFAALSARRGGIAAAAAIAVLGTVLLWQAGDLDAGTLALPGPGFMPRLLGGVLVVLGAVTAATEWRPCGRGGSDGDTAPAPAAGAATVALGHRDVVVVFAAMLAVPALFEWLGAYLTLGVFVAVLLVMVARARIVVAVTAAALAMAACWYFFAVLLGLALPLGSILEGLP